MSMKSARTRKDEIGQNNQLMRTMWICIDATTNPSCSRCIIQLCQHHLWPPPMTKTIFRSLQEQKQKQKHSVNSEE
eukprot:scaffold12161_cov81-Skeletonema_dohrnii-CCMP3373.AAC.1